MKIAGLSAFGFGGTNAHAIIAETALPLREGDGAESDGEFGSASSHLDEDETSEKSGPKAEIIGMGTVFGTKIRRLQDLCRMLLAEEEAGFEWFERSESYGRWGALLKQKLEQVTKMSTNEFCAAPLEELEVQFDKIKMSMKPEERLHLQTLKGFHAMH
jgi:hypothetical protein